ncbi:hypothetical protein, partial [Pseudomonas aeruginosa]|uniref:hypothetical protein n=1 Tax=Pseudomonas aeruginosa TaxID=287 RepID=UPI0015D5115F
MKIAIAKLDAALDKFWIGVVLHAYHRLMSAHYRRKAARLAQKVQGRANEIQNPAYQVRVRIPRHPATQSALIWPGIPGPSGHLFHGHPAGQSERSDAGVA